ncbi:MAG TPA: pyridoxal-dependent decarboxylase [Gemmatimonadales bacterium]|nr:pyridoxal-dependent decarboxylase [Gemmatimonadales bacterium]
MTPEEFRRIGHRVVDWIADYRAGIASRPVLSRSTPGAVRQRLPSRPPETGEPLDALLRDLDETILPGITHWQHPAFFSYFPANATLASTIGDFLSTGLGVIGLNWQASPALTELELLMADWMRQMVGLSPGWSGAIHDTASTATLVALLCARERTTSFSMQRGGLQAEPHPLVVYASTESHSSVLKAALLAGFGRERVRAIPVDGAFALDALALRKSLAADKAQGLVPCVLVATSGTTSSTALDPVEAMADLAGEYGCWLHVDAAMAGSAMILPECRWMWAGIEGADSIVLNPHKWLGAVFDCSLYYVRDVEHLVRVMSTNPSYLRTPVDAQAVNLRDWNIPLGRRFRALKLWALIRSEGVAGLQARLRRDLENAQWLAGQVDAARDWERIAPVPLQTVCVRHRPPGLDGEALDRHTLAWLERINRSGDAFLNATVLGGRWTVRVSIGAEMTERAHVAALWERMQTVAREVEAT